MVWEEREMVHGSCLSLPLPCLPCPPYSSLSRGKRGRDLVLSIDFRLCHIRVIVFSCVVVDSIPYLDVAVHVALDNGEDGSEEVYSVD